jgi:hypothetical protein
MTKEEFTELYSRARAGDAGAITQLQALLDNANKDEPYSSWIGDINLEKTLHSGIPDSFETLLPDEPPELETPAYLKSSNEPSPRVETPHISPEQEAGRLRAYRSNMLRRLRKHFGFLQSFTVEQAVMRLKRDKHEISEYLRVEASQRASQIGYNRESNKYFIKSPFM